MLSKLDLFNWCNPLYLMWIRIIFAFITIIVLFQGNWFYSIFIFTLYQFVFLLDYVDGPLAKKKKVFNIKYQQIDRQAHNIISFLLLLGITIGFTTGWFLYIGIFGS